MDDLSEFLDDFRAESREALDVIENEIMSMETGDEQALARVFRAMHSMKGGSGFLGLSAINHLAHQLENLLTEVREGRMTVEPGLCDLLLRGSDQLKQMIDLPDFGAGIDTRELLAETAARLAGQVAAADLPALEPRQPAVPPPPAVPAPRVATCGPLASACQQGPMTFAMWLALGERVAIHDLFDALMSQEYRTLHPLDLLRREGFAPGDCVIIACYAQRHGVHPFRAAEEMGLLDAPGRQQLEARLANSRPSIGQILVELGIEQSLTVRSWLEEYYEYRLQHPT